ncbi:MAG: hypothetical protein JJE18_01375 [Eubacteriaceae bacterium]|nr:hypothetical protein [Eubacteriaceae bacterium]
MKKYEYEIIKMGKRKNIVIIAPANRKSELIDFSRELMIRSEGNLEK